MLAFEILARLYLGSSNVQEALLVGHFGGILECVNVQYELGLQAYDDVDVDKYLDYGQVDELWLVEVSDSVENEVDGELEQVEED